MRLDDLKRFGIPERIIEIWRKRQGDSLLPVQIKAIRKGLLNDKVSKLDSSNMLITAPTSAGKSFCAELSAVKAIVARQKTVMLFPLKSLAEQKHKLFQETYAELGIKCLIVTSDHPENDKAFSDGNYHIAFVIYEKLDLTLTASLDSLKNIALLVVDEVQTIAEPNRGAILERLLTKVLASIYNPTIVALSAVIGWEEESRGSDLEVIGHSRNGHNGDSAISSEKLASWLRAVLVEETVRPVDLIRGVATGGSYSYRSYNDHLDGSEPFVEIESGDHLFEMFIKQIKKDAGSTLIFLKSRTETVQSAFRMASAVNWKPAREALSKLSYEEPSFLTRSLRQALSRGVAFHNSDLSSYQREIVEEAFINEEVKALFSTTTLSMGVNLPADTVYLETVKYSSGNYNSRPSLVPVTRAEFDNMAGRAGRLGLSKNNKPGRAIILAESDFDKDILWENYIESGKSTPLKSAFMSVPLSDWALDMAASGLVHTEGGLERVFGSTLYAKSNSGNATDFEYCLTLLDNEKLLNFQRDSKTMTVLPLGKAVAQTGLPVKEATYFLKQISQSRPENFSQMLALALSGSSYNLPPSILSRFEVNENSPMAMLYQKNDHLLSDLPFLLGDDFHNKSLSYRESASLKAFLLLHSWVEMTPIQKIEEQFQLHLGQVVSLGESLAHLVHAIGSLMCVVDNDKEISKTTNEYAFSLRFGLDIKWQSAKLFFKDLLNRHDYYAFGCAKINSLEDIIAISSERLSRIIENKNKQKEIISKIKTFNKENKMQTTTFTPNQTQSQKENLSLIPNMPESVEVNGTYEKERYLLNINGFPVRLTGKSFKYFVKLAWARLYGGESGWIYKEDIEHGFNQARYLYRMKNEVSSGLNIDWQIVENNRLGYYRLAALPSNITINLENLKDHPDYEIQQIVAKEMNQKVN